MYILLKLQLLPSASDGICVRTEFRGDVPIELVAAEIFKKMRLNAEAFLSNASSVGDAVIAIPSWFSEEEKRGIRIAAENAELNVLRLLTESEAAVLPHFHSIQPGQNVLVFDMGGQGLNVNVLRSGSPGAFEALGRPVYEAALGGEQFDLRLTEHFAKEFEKKNRRDISENRRSWNRLKVACETAKRTLSSSEQANIEVDSLFEGIDFYTMISRVRFEALCADLFQRLIEVVDAKLREVHYDRGDIDKIVLAGGSAYIPKIQRSLKEYFGEDKEIARNPAFDEVVSYGAAMDAAVLAGLRGPSGMRRNASGIHRNKPHSNNNNNHNNASKSHNITDQSDYDSYSNGGDSSLHYVPPKAKKKKNFFFCCC